MALVIRMRQQGAKNRQRFRIVVTESRNPRDGKYLEKLGWYNPFAPNEKNHFIDVARLQYWMDNGAQISDTVRSLVKVKSPEVVQRITEKQVAKKEKARVKRKKQLQT
ncbi:MAG TPA: 30S ribosomal protein S16 [Chlamydiales bacterium]|nr:30S ribosomal protein S16 [Chlamydiales bacterium]